MLYFSIWQNSKEQIWKVCFIHPSTPFQCCYDTDLSHFEESHSSEQGVTASLMLWPNPFQFKLICYFLQPTLQVLAAFHKVL